jgi:hypothetical protein
MATRCAQWRRRAAQLLVLMLACLFPVACGGSPHANGKPQPLTYYLSPSGNDAAAGTSPADAWRSLGRASHASLKPGTRLLLRGGSEFTGQLTLNERDAGNAARPVVIGSYGSGVATIASKGSAIDVYDTAGIDIGDLNLIGRPSSGAAAVGLTVYNDLPAGRRLNHVVVRNITVVGFANGVAFGGKNSGAGFGDVTVSNCVLDGNVNDGLITYGPEFNPGHPTYANQDVDVSHVIAARNSGDPHSAVGNTGNGIVLGSVRDGTIAWSTADNNGSDSVATEGPEGIWAYDSTRIVMERNLSFENRTNNRVDGNGFGLDQNTSDSVMQDNLSYDNDGTGFLVYSAQENSAQTHNIVRYNISSGNSQDGNSHYGGISVLGTVADAAVYQNTVVMAGSPALRLGLTVNHILVRNNIFVADHGPVVAAAGALRPAMAELQGNDYFSAVGPWAVTWGPESYDSLSAWRAISTEEMVAGRPSGFAVDPRLTGPVLNLQDKMAGRGSAGDRFILRLGSPLLGAGLNLARLGMNPRPTNFAGKAESLQHPNVGAQ